MTSRKIIRIPRATIGRSSRSNNRDLERQVLLQEQMELPSEQNEVDAPRTHEGWLSFVRSEARRRGFSNANVQFTGLKFTPDAIYFTINKRPVGIATGVTRHSDASAASEAEFRIESDIELLQQALRVFALPGVQITTGDYRSIVQQVGRSVRAIHTALAETRMLKYETMTASLIRSTQFEEALIGTKLQPILSVSLEEFVWFESPNPAVFGASQTRFGWRVDEHDDDVAPHRMTLIDPTVVQPLQERILKWFNRL